MSTRRTFVAQLAAVLSAVPLLGRALSVKRLHRCWECGKASAGRAVEMGMCCEACQEAFFERHEFFEQSRASWRAERKSIAQETS